MSSSNVEQIKERLDIVDVISSYIKVQKAGINFKAKCPFHNEKTPSFFISPTRQTFYCFGCGEKGDIFSFVEKFEGIDFKGALKTLAERAGVELKNFKDNGREEKDKLFEILEEATKFFEKNLENNKPALDYLRKRGLNKNSIKKWRLGFAKDEWRNMYDYLTNKSIEKNKMLEAGLIKKVENEDKYYDTFRNRIIFPIFDSANRIIAFSGRSLKENEKTPKYLNTPETKLFYKSEVLYGFNEAKNSIRRLNYAVLVEGQMDLLLSHQTGISNTVASSGTALTELHLKKIKKLTNRIVIAYDSDESGEKASRRAAELALNLNMEIKTTILPKGEDPASIIKKNPQNWRIFLKESKHFIDFVLEKAYKEKQGINLSEEIIKNVLPLVKLIQSEIEQSRLIKKIAARINISEEAVWNDFKKITALDQIDYEDSIKETPKKINLERMMVGILFWEESQKIKKGRDLNFKKRWQKIASKEKVEEIIKFYNDDREVLIFEAERYSQEGDIKRTAENILNRIEQNHLKEKLIILTNELDEPKLLKPQQKKIETELINTQKRLKEISQL
ncbi:MAG: DNA primase, partial [Candidatus Zambryskibacteria bacterium]|nr:DNA primase [Candidatus Zambryskibacteria bacterium]